MDTEREPAEIPPTNAEPNEESIDTAEAELDASPLVIAPKQAGSAVAWNSKMVSGNSPQAKSKVDHVTYGIDEIKQISEKILKLLSTLQQQQDQQQHQQAGQQQQRASPVTEVPEESSILTEVDKKVQQILKCCTDLCTMEEENKKTISEQFSKSEEKAKRYEEEQQRLNSDLKNLKEKFDDVERNKQEVEKYKKEAENYKQEAEKLKEEAEKLKEEAQQYKNEILESKYELRLCNHKEQHFKTVSERLDEENKNYQKEIEKQKSTIEDIKHQNVEMKSENEVQKSSIEELKRKNETQSSSIEELRRQNEEMKSENEKLKHQNEGLNSKLEKDRGYCYAKQQQEIAEGKQKELNELKEKHDHLLQKLSDKDTEIRSLERTVERLKGLNEGTEKLIDYQKKDVEHHRAIQGMREVLARSTSSGHLEMMEESERRTRMVSSSGQSPQS